MISRVCGLFIGFTTDAKRNFLPIRTMGRKFKKQAKKKMPARQIKTKDLKKKK